MKIERAVLILGLLGLLGLPRLAFAANGEQYTLEFLPTHNALPGVTGKMRITVMNGNTIVTFKLRGGYPDTVYTIWTVFSQLVWPYTPDPNNPTRVPATPATDHPGFPPDGNGISPTARLGKPFTDGMGWDQGMTFVTDRNGHGEKRVMLDFNLIYEAPVSNSGEILQCAPTSSNCTKKVRVTTTWLRRFIGEFAIADRSAMCANYDYKSDADPANPFYDPVVPGLDARLWQCVDPATVNGNGGGLPRVHRFEFDHFRLAPHPDRLTHGFIGGNTTDHFIDMIGRRCDLLPPVGPPC
jgi:hypothetical protein